MTIRPAAMYGHAPALGWRLALAMVTLLGLAGCASRSGEPGSSGHIVTASDETDAHKRARIRMELATGYFEQGKTGIALDEVKQALVADPTSSDAYNLRGLIYMRLNEPQQAEDSFRRAVAINGRDASAQHNLGWLLCQQRRFDEATRAFDQAMANPLYGERAKSLMAQGLCHARAGRNAEAEASLARSLELDAANPVTGYNLANILFQRGEYQRAQFYIRRLNNGEFANAETLWLGIKIERRMQDMVALRQLGDQLKRRFGASKEASAYERGAFDE